MLWDLADLAGGATGSVQNCRIELDHGAEIDRQVEQLCQRVSTRTTEPAPLRLSA